MSGDLGVVELLSFVVTIIRSRNGFDAWERFFADDWSIEVSERVLLFAEFKSYRSFREVLVSIVKVRKQLFVDIEHTKLHLQDLPYWFSQPAKTIKTQQVFPATYEVPTSDFVPVP